MLVAHLTICRFYDSTVCTLQGLDPDDMRMCPTEMFPSASCPPAAPREYMCPPQGSHVICTCCLQPMPDRRAELIGQQLSTQQCEWPAGLSINVNGPMARVLWLKVLMGVVLCVG